MTPFLAALIPATAAATWWVTYRWLTVRYDLHGYDKVYLAAFRAKDVCADADHEHRLRLRREAELAQKTDSVGPLLDTVVLQRRRIDALTRRSPVPSYGRWTS